MTFRERLDTEKNNLNKIILFNNGGLFFHLMERSAYAFYTRIKPFKVHVRMLKGLCRPFVWIGVPVDKADKYLQGLATEKDEYGNIMALLKEPIDEQVFLTWKEMVINHEELAQTHARTKEDTAIRLCLQEVRQLNIAAMTPVEAMSYLNSLQQKIKDIQL